jgi:hypothetical protein
MFAGENFFFRDSMMQFRLYKVEVAGCIIEAMISKIWIIKPKEMRQFKSRYHISDQ